MSRITIPAVENTPAAAQPLLDAVQKQLGMVPNLMRLLAHSPAALEAYLSFTGALAKTSISIALRERIALAIAEYNACDYCLSAHDYLGRQVARISDAEIHAARDARSEDARTEAALQFALRVAQARGQVSDAEIASLRLAGFDQAAILEIVVTVALNVLTNYVNNVARTAIDFPLVRAKAA